MKFKHIALGVGGALALAAAAFAIAGGPLADIKPDVITAEPQPERQARGAALLQSAYAAAGGDALLGHQAARFEFEDVWSGMAKMFSPWPDPEQRATVTLTTHSFDSMAELHNGPAAGTTWGIEGGAGWTEAGAVRTPSDDPNLLFMLPTVHYFVEMPQRLTEAPITRWVEERTVGDARYDVVYATWDSVLAHDEHDQYLAFISQATGRLEKVQYTVREVGRYVSGTGHLDDQRLVGDVWIAHDMVVTQNPDDPLDSALHRMVLSDFVWDPAG